VLLTPISPSGTLTLATGEIEVLRRLRASQPKVGSGSVGLTPNADQNGGRRVRAWRAALPLGVLALTLAVGTPTANAATISVNTSADELNADGDCSLREAITAANTNTAVDACPAGQPAPTVDVIGFSVTGTITLTSGQLTITDDLTIDGPGATNLTISGNNATRVLVVGGGVTLTLEGVTVADGSASEGGGIQNLPGAALTVTNSTFFGNSATAGGAIENFYNGATLTVTNSTFSGNSGTFGGAIYNVGTLTVSNSTLSGNSGGTRGAGIDNGGTLTVTDSTFSGNLATSGGDGGGIASYGGTVTVTNSTFSGNSASGVGGGIDNLLFPGGALTVTNSTFSGNSATQGGGIHNYAGATLTVTNSTFSGNSAAQGGGISNYGAGTLRNTVVADSTSGGNCAGAITGGGGNLSWPDATCPGINQDPLLEPLANNGGPTQTMALMPGSAAIDTAVLANCPATDQRGVPRPQGAGCDIGAFELEVTNNPPSCASVVASPNRLWPPNHKLVLITLSGATDPDGDTVTLTVTGVTQDEPISGLGPGDLSPDAQVGPQSNKVFIRSERSDTGNGRVYRISFTGADGKGGTCSGTAKVGVPKTQRGTAVDSAPPSYNSFGP
jgi:CSLREA domain-containing protein